MRLGAGMLAWVLVVASGMGPAALAGGFVAPAEGPVAFRRDKLPLDEEAIAGLSRQLVQLAVGLPADSASNRRGAAQMLALAMALDPGNARARQLVTEFKEGRHQSESAREQLEKSRARVWQLINWLDSADAGNHGRLLADCLKDVIVVSDPEHPKAEAMKAAGEKGAWNGWVAATSAFEDEGAVARQDHRDDPPVNSNNPPDKGTSKAQLQEARVGVVLWKNAGTSEAPNWVLAPADLKMTVKNTEDGGENGFAVHIGVDEHWDMFDKTNRTISRLLATRHDKLPNVNVVISGKELGLSIGSGKRQSVSAAAAVLANAAVTGVAPDATVLGQIDSSGTYRMSSGFWKQVRSLGKGGGRKLLIPADAAPLMPAFLAMENPGFFMEHEVLVAADCKQLLDLATADPADPSAPAMAKFKEIRERSAGQELRQYVANRFIRQRLLEVVQAAPSHLSARMLLIQAEGKRPTLVPRKVLAAELRCAIEPMAWISIDEYDDLGSSQLAKLGATYETCRTAVDALSRYVDKADMPLFDKTRDLILEVRTLDRASRIRGDYDYVQESIRSARRNLINHAGAVDELLATEAGDTPSQ